jgi:hypothetical protein
MMVGLRTYIKMTFKLRSTSHAISTMRSHRRMNMKIIGPATSSRPTIRCREKAQNSIRQNFKMFFKVQVRIILRVTPSMMSSDQVPNSRNTFSLGPPASISGG